MDIKKTEEQEFKYLVDEEYFNKARNKLIKLYPEATEEIIEQINYYYDNKKRDLRKKKTTVRVRVTDNCLKLQIKQHAKSKQLYSISTEYETEIQSLPYFLNINGEDYSLQGSLYTKRIRYRICDDITVDFDKNMYLGKIDYEIEIEFLKSKFAEAEELKEMMEIPLTTKKKGKASRFFYEKEKNATKTLFIEI